MRLEESHRATQNALEELLHIFMKIFERDVHNEYEDRRYEIADLFLGAGLENEDMLQAFAPIQEGKS